MEVENRKYFNAQDKQCDYPSFLNILKITRKKM